MFSLLKARNLVYEHVKTKDHIDTKFGIDDVYVVAFSNTLNHWKALVNTTLLDETYYEVSYCGDSGVAYIDTYKKSESIRIPDSE